MFVLKTRALVSLALLLGAVTLAAMATLGMKQEDQSWIYSRVGSKVSECRKASGKTQKDLAEGVGLTRASIANIESGRQKILLHSLYQIAQVLDVQLVDLLPPPPTKPLATTQIDVSRLIEGRSKQEQNFIRRAVEQVERR